MQITSGLCGGSTVPAAAAAENAPSLQKAVKAYRDEYLTGLTDDEKAEIEKRTTEFIKDFVSKHPINDKNDRKALVDAVNAFVSSLLRKFGYKGDINECASGMAVGILSKTDKANDGTSVPNSVSAKLNATAQTSSYRNAVPSLADALSNPSDPFGTDYVNAFLTETYEKNMSFLDPAPNARTLALLA